MRRVYAFYQPLVGMVMHAKQDKLEELVQLSVELGKATFSERMTRTQLRGIRASMLSIRKRLKRGARLIRPSEERDGLSISDHESLGVAYRRELGRLERRRQLFLGLHNMQRLEVSRLRLAVNRAKQALLFK